MGCNVSDRMLNMCLSAAWIRFQMLFVHRGLRCYAAGTAKQGRRRLTGDIATAELQLEGGACHFQSFGRTNVHTTLKAVWPRTPDWEETTH